MWFWFWLFKTRVKKLRRRQKIETPAQVFFIFFLEFQIILFKIHWINQKIPLPAFRLTTKVWPLLINPKSFHQRNVLHNITIKRVWLSQNTFNQPVWTSFEHQHNCQSFFSDFLIIYVELTNSSKSYKSFKTLKHEKLVWSCLLVCFWTYNLFRNDFL